MVIGVGSISSFMSALGEWVAWLRVSRFRLPLEIEAISERILKSSA